MKSKVFYSAQLDTLLDWARGSLLPEDQALVEPHLVWAKSNRSKGFYPYKGGFRFVGDGLYRAMLEVRERQRERAKGTGLLAEVNATWQTDFIGSTLYAEWVWE